MLLHDAAGDEQAETGSSRSFCGEEVGEYPLPGLGVHSATGVFDLEYD